MKISALDHIQMAIPEGGEHLARAFYIDVLGFIEQPKPDRLAKHGGVWLTSGALKLHLGVDPEFRSALKAHPALLVAGLAELTTRCVAAGYQIFTAEPLEGYQRVFVSDPFGNRIELLEPETTTIDLGLSHIALPVLAVDRSIEFYAQYAGMEIVHRRIDAETGVAVVWLSDRTRPFVIVLIQKDEVHPVLSPLAHLGVGCKSRAAMDTLCDAARQAGVLLQEPKDSGYPIGYWAFLRDPDGHTLELSVGQEIGLTLGRAGGQAHVSE
jgi:catechol 2,3-dioxygenase-like lactoylglutathione lyase family enzyme